MTTPALQRLRERLPRAQITLLTPEKLAQLWEQQPWFDRVETFRSGESPWTIARRLRTGGFDAALVLPNSHRSALEVWLAGIPHRIGYAGTWRNWLLTSPVSHPPDWQPMRRRGIREIKRLARGVSNSPAGRPRTRYQHQTRDYLHLISALGANPAPLAPKLVLAAQEIESAVAACLGKIQRGKTFSNFRQATWLGLNPSAAYGPAKCWPIERFINAVQEISKRVPDTAWLVFGSESDRLASEKVTAACPGRVVNLSGETSLRQLMALLKTCRVLLSNDSGPMHVAAALGTPVVVPFGSTSPELTGPSQLGDPRHQLLGTTAPCAPCFRRTCPIDFRCMLEISVDAVVRAVLEIVQPQLAPRSPF
jgi:heptosyltransferase-2